MARLLVLDNVTPPLIRLVCGIANTIASMPIQDVTITHGTDGVHKAGSLHGIGAALDVRTHNQTDVHKTALFTMLSEKFPAPRFDVIFEDRGGPNEHIHIEDNFAKRDATPGFPPPPLRTA